MFVKRRITENVYVMALQRLNDMAKAKLPEPQYPEVELHILRYHVCTPMSLVAIKSTFVNGTP
jgi:hypothetical protein